MSRSHHSCISYLQNKLTKVTCSGRQYLIWVPMSQVLTEIYTLDTTENGKSSPSWQPKNRWNALDGDLELRH
jgi:hypothetical protein